MLYFNNNDGGVQDGGTLGNYSQDSGNTVPAVALPTSSDDVTLNCDMLACTGGLTCHDLYINGFSIGPSNGAATAVTVNSVTLVNAPGSGSNYWNTTTAYGGPSPLSAVGPVTFLTDPGVNIAGSTGTTYQVSLANGISDDGTGEFNNQSAITIGGAVTWGATLSNVAAAVSFNGGLAVTESITSSNVTCTAGTISATVSITAGSYSGTITTPAFSSSSATLNGGTLTTTTFTGVHAAGAVTLTGATATYAPSSRSGGSVTTDGSVVTISYDDPITGDNFATAAATFTPAQYVLTGQSSGPNPGTLTLPPTSNVLSPSAGGPASWGVGGTGSTGTYLPTGVRQNGYAGGFNI